MRRPANIAVIGWGSFFQHIHEQNLRRLIQTGKCRLRAIADTDDGNLDALVKTHAPDHAFTDYRKVLRDPQVDAVIIAAPHNIQASCALDVLHAGKWVYVEKPLFAPSAIPASQSLDALHALGQPAMQHLAVGFNKRFAPAYRDLRNMANGWNGLKNIRISIVDDAWRWGAKYPPGFLFWLDLCHWTDLARWFTGAEIEAVSCLNPQVEDYSFTLKMSDGSIASIFLSGNGSMDMIKEEIHVTTGTKTCASIFDYVQLEVFGSPKRLVKTYPGNLQSGGDEEYVRAITEGGLDALRSIRREMLDRFLQNPRDEHLQRNLPNFMRPQGWRESLESFVNAVLTGERDSHHATYRDAYLAHQTVEASKTSVANGGAFISIPVLTA